MPNHITNIIEVDKDISVINKFMYGGKEDKEETLFDFNKLDPIPKELKGTTSPTRKEEKETEKEFKKRTRSLIEKYGYDNWYDWQCAHWGTKWNAYDILLNGNTIQFNTAWSHPAPIIEKLSKQFPAITFNVEYADEDIGSNYGHYVMVDGEMIEDLTPEGQEGVKFACDIKGYDYSEYIEADVEKESSHEVNL